MNTHIENIRAEYEHYGPTNKLKPNTAVLHIRQLLEEIDRLKNTNESIDALVSTNGYYCERWHEAK